MIDGQSAVEREQIKQMQPDRLLSAQSLDVLDPPKAAHELLKRQWARQRIDRDDFTIQNRRTLAKLLDHVDHFRQACGDFVHAPRKNASRTFAVMDLHAGAIELVLERELRPEH